MTQRKPLIAGNWKLHNTVAESQALASAIAAHVGAGLACEVVVGPVATSLAAVAETVGESAVGVAAQNTHWEDSGAFTGELSPTLIQDVGCGHCIIGHSERRQFFGETDAGVRKKVAALLVHKIVPIVCVGESLEQREAGQTLDVVLGQVEAPAAPPRRKTHRKYMARSAPSSPSSRANPGQPRFAFCMVGA
jgi:triosephosphate isomerase